MKEIPIDKIRRDIDLQPRAQMNLGVVDEYAEAMLAGAVFPPVDVYFDDEWYWLADGFHRVAAAERCEQDTISVIVHKGDKRAAKLHGVGANVAHGLRRTNADKHKSVVTLLRDPEWCGWSGREIARRCGVSPNTVENIRRELSAQNEQIDAVTSAERIVRRGNTTYTMDTSKIGDAVTPVRLEPVQEEQIASVPVVMEGEESSKPQVEGQKSQPSILESVARKVIAPPQTVTPKRKPVAPPVKKAPAAVILTARIWGKNGAEKVSVGMGPEGQGPEILRMGKRTDLRRLLSQVIAQYYQESSQMEA